jgi:hypothetical protein
MVIFDQHLKGLRRGAGPCREKKEMTMGCVIVLVAIIGPVAERDMAVSRDVQTKNNLLAVRAKIFIMPMLEFNRTRIRGCVLAYECNRCAAIMNFICQQFVQLNGIA